MNPHPPLTGAPGTLLTLALLSEIIALARRREQFQRYSAWLVVSAAILTPLTYYTGYWGAEYASQTFKVADETIATHQGWAKLLLISYAPLLMLLYTSRSNPTKLLRTLYFLNLVLCCALVIWTSYLGGQLVFTHGAGVSTPK